MPGMRPRAYLPQKNISILSMKIPMRAVRRAEPLSKSDPMAIMNNKTKARIS
jgi:hypothetical protein